MDNNPFHDYEEDTDWNLEDYNDDVDEIRKSIANRTLINRIAESIDQVAVRRNQNWFWLQGNLLKGIVNKKIWTEGIYFV